MFMQDNFLGAPVCLVGFEDGGGNGGPGDFLSLKNPAYQTTSCIVNQNYQGTFEIDNADGSIVPVGRGVPVGTLKDGGAIETEIRQIGAGLGPSVIPYSTAPLTTSPSSWTIGRGTGTITTGILDPAGGTTAGEIDVTGGNDAQVEVGSISGTFAVGDQFLYGIWVRPGQNLSFTHGAYGNNASFLLADYGGSIVLTPNIPSAFGMSLLNDKWHPQIALAAVTTGGSGTVGFWLDTQGLGGSLAYGNQYWGPCLMYIPASVHVPQNEVERWRQDLMHGTCPSNYTGGTGHAATLAPIDAPSFNVLNPSTGVTSPLGTANLGDWTDSGVAGGYAPIWNATTSKWTPGAVASAPTETYDASASGSIVLPSTDRAEATYVLSGNVTNTTIAGGAGGAKVTIIVCQPASGGPYTWAWPSNWKGGVTIGTTASTCSLQVGTYVAGQSDWKGDAGATNVPQ